MSKARDTLLSLTLLALVFTGPAAVAAYLLSSGNSEAPLMLAAATDGRPALATDTANARRQPSVASVLAGVLYTRGTAQVDWNGTKIPVVDGSYAYLGGETVSTGPGNMSVLRLDADNSVYMCPASRMSLARDDDGAYQIKISEGGGRFAFAPGTDYRVEVNQGVLSPGADAATQPTVMEASVFQRHPGGVVCGFSGDVDVAGYPAGGGGGPIALGTAGAGEIIDLSRALRGEVATGGTPLVMQPIPMPAGVQAWLRNNAPYPPEAGPIGYLCRCMELKRYADADGIPDAAILPRMSPPGTAALATLARDGGPPVAPPELPPAVLAVPGAPDPADPGVLPSTPTTLTVPAPLVPISGSGGGFVSTPS
ncbi:MAG: hypothetical protein BMS9Abin05_1221 [Rhodothermia bacterium]|nr:MAG: hypothetical protein BMS9Abin05_1221 [Rhodothermia bacterium]